jgi:hypothetical protein
MTATDSKTRTESSSSSGSTPSASDALSGRNELVSYDCGCVQTSGQFDLVLANALRNPCALGTVGWT